ncbi:MAG: amino acid ABC transporter substrate-binding protein [Candidatus Omnitrophota bacterium]|jgi:ABC-type branched-subunit amino acid transport system substrate-binding protein|nr:MAG: amino acid ABC transporter substrate-binding protein [Candidatus Omnitrophota bacterium]
MNFISILIILIPFGEGILFAADAVPVPNKTMLDDPLEFTGWEGEWGDPKQLGEIRIGLFAPDDPDDRIGSAMLNGATLAIMQANRDGGYQGVPFRLITRWADDPWGAGSKEMIRLVYEDQVWAILGSLNGDATHVAEQIVTKARVPLLCPVSADPTLTFIRIPWIFRLPPDDRAQAEALVKEGIVPLSLPKIGMITSTDHDGRTAAFELENALKREQIAPAFHFQISPEDSDLSPIIARMRSFEPDGIVLRLPHHQLHDFITKLRSGDIRFPLFLPWIPGFHLDSMLDRYDGTIGLVQPFAPKENDKQYQSFAAAYSLQFGAQSDVCAAYTYDAIKILVHCIHTTGLNRVALRKAISYLQNYQGVAGQVVWDNGGGNTVKPVMTIVNKH